MSFEAQKYEDLMHNGAVLHATGQYEEALDALTDAMVMSDIGSKPAEMGRALREMSAAYLELGHTEDAVTAACMALKAHENFTTGGEGIEVELQDLAISRMQFGSVMLYGAIEAEQEGDKVTAGSEASRASIFLGDAQIAAASSEDQRPDQYEVDLLRKSSIAESLYGKGDVGMQLGRNALFLALLSESPNFVKNTTDLLLIDKLRAKLNAVTGAVGALSVGLLEKIPGSVTRKASLSLAKRVL